MQQNKTLVNPKRSPQKIITVSRQNSHAFMSSYLHFEFDAQKLNHLMRSIAQNQECNLIQFKMVCLALGFLVSKDYLDYLDILALYNTAFEQTIKLKRRPQQLKVKSSDLITAEWLWDFMITICQNDVYIPEKLLFEILNCLIKMETDTQECAREIAQLARYYQEIYKHQDQNIFKVEFEQYKKELKIILDPFYETIEEFIRYFRSHIQQYSSCKIYGFKRKEIRDDYPQKREDNSHKKNEIVNEKPKINVFDQLFSQYGKFKQHSNFTQLPQEKKQKRSVGKSSDIVKSNPRRKRSVTPQRKQRKSPEESISQDFEKSLQSSHQLPCKFIQIKSREAPTLLLSDIKGVPQMMKRMNDARIKQFEKDNFWEFRASRVADYAERSKSMSPFEFSVHRIPHPKPVLFVEVETQIGKKQRIGLYGGDDYEQIAQNFGKAHSLNQSQIKGLQIRIRQIYEETFTQH